MNLYFINKPRPLKTLKIQYPHFYNRADSDLNNKEKKNNNSINKIDGTLTNNSENISGGVNKATVNNNSMYKNFLLFSKLNNTLIKPNTSVNKLK